MGRWVGGRVVGVSGWVVGWVGGRVVGWVEGRWVGGWAGGWVGIREEDVVNVVGSGDQSAHRAAHGKNPLKARSNALREKKRKRKKEEHTGRRSLGFAQS